MKRKIFLVVAVAVAMALTAGCAAYYGNEAQYERGDWYGLAGSREIARIKQNKLAIDKLRAQPVKTGIMTQGGAVPAEQTEAKTKTWPPSPSAGYYGVIANMSRYQGRRYLFKYWGPETGVYYLKPGEKKHLYLIPGDYYGEIYYAGQLTGSTSFRSEPQEKSFDGEQVHWMFYAEY